MKQQDIVQATVRQGLELPRRARLPGQPGARSGSAASSSRSSSCSAGPTTRRCATGATPCCAKAQATGPLRQPRFRLQGEPAGPARPDRPRARRRSRRLDRGHRPHARTDVRRDARSRPSSTGRGILRHHPRPRRRTGRRRTTSPTPSCAPPNGDLVPLSAFVTPDGVRRAADAQPLRPPALDHDPVGSLTPGVSIGAGPRRRWSEIVRDDLPPEVAHRLPGPVEGVQGRLERHLRHLRRWRSSSSSWCWRRSSRAGSTRSSSC